MEIEVEGGGGAVAGTWGQVCPSGAENKAWGGGYNNAGGGQVQGRSHEMHVQSSEPGQLGSRAARLAARPWEGSLVPLSLFPSSIQGTGGAGHYSHEPHPFLIMTPGKNTFSIPSRMQNVYGQLKQKFPEHVLFSPGIVYSGRNVFSVSFSKAAHHPPG